MPQTCAVLHLLGPDRVSAQRCCHPDAQDLLQLHQQAWQQSQTRSLLLWSAQRRAALPEAACRHLALQLTMKAPVVELQSLPPGWCGLHIKEKQLHFQGFPEMSCSFCIVYHIFLIGLKGEQQGLIKLRQGGRYTLDQHKAPTLALRWVKGCR